MIPDTEEVTALDTSGISLAVQCEMRDAWVDVLVGGIARLPANQAVAATMTRQALLAAYPVGNSLSEQDLDNWRAENEARTFETFLARGYRTLPRKDPELEFAVETYSNVFITMKFVFDLTQSNDAGASVDLLTVVSRGTLTSPIGGTIAGKHQAKLEKVTGTRVADLLTNRPVIRICNKYRKGETPPNLLYPIAGNLNLKNDVQGFITDNQSGNLIGQYSDADLLSAINNTPVPSINKTYTFQTTLSGGLSDAKLELAPRASGTSVKLAQFTLSGSRVDVHKLILVLQLPNVQSLTVAQARNRQEAAQLAQQLNSSAKELQRIEERDKVSSELLRLLTSD
jgi:hypothetical protein